MLKLFSFILLSFTITSCAGPAHYIAPGLTEDTGVLLNLVNFSLISIDGKPAVDSIWTYRPRSVRLTQGSHRLKILYSETQGLASFSADPVEVEIFLEQGHNYRLYVAYPEKIECITIGCSHKIVYELQDLSETNPRKAFSRVRIIGG